MATHRNNNKTKKIGRMVKLRILIEKLQKGLLLIGRRSSSSCYDVPKDVKEGHFAVIAEDGEGPMRFVVSLRYLTHPTFLRLLEQATQEYGFGQEGAISIPCRPCELESILAQPWPEEEGALENPGTLGVKPCFKAPADDTNMKEWICPSN
ncbi:protein SMALL AUXIN UP-REGULATED RNA 16-like [Prosopis cineraria]|uniref:protein SMALL AUXIN UP-REGULATED RNA 16-like n=1 Tax=Prosopis cineraria TaxID=364024 RepID=UPI00240FB9C3|nr:protein SMALL AUXIN UP-REGULATED RNA 16-like [Prosopis cineraria]XP_054793108.1 protein SMALL AUXIN UP-REGULATED RNA 16-like [Prosopis cineraria]